MGTPAEFPKTDSRNSSGVSVSEHLDPEWAAHLKEQFNIETSGTDNGTTADEQVTHIEREDYVPEEERLIRAAHESVAQSKADDADEGEPVTVTVSPASSRPVPTAPKPTAQQKATKAPAQSTQVESTQEPDDIDNLLNEVDVSRSTQPESDSVLAGKALRKARRGSSRFAFRSQKTMHRQAAESAANAPRPTPPKPQVPQPENQPPARAVVVEQVESTPAQPEAPKKKKAEQETTDASTLRVRKAESSITSLDELENALKNEPEVAPAKPEVVRPGREHHIKEQVHADELHPTHEVVERKSLFERLANRARQAKNFFAEKVLVSEPEKVAAEAPTPVVPTPAVAPKVEAATSTPKPRGERVNRDPIHRSKDEIEAREIAKKSRTTADDKREAWGENEDNEATKADLEAYKQARPAKPEGEDALRRSVDKNGRPIFYNQYGIRVSEEDYYNSVYKHQGGTADVSKAYYGQKREQEERNAAHGEALVTNEQRDKEFAEVLRARTEGEKLISRDPRLRGLMALGQELQGMSGASDAQKERNAATYEAKRQMFDDLVELYRSKGVDERAIGFILHETIHPIDHENYNPIQGAAYLDGKRVTVRDYNESKDGTQSAYVVEHEDGSISSAFGDDLEFKREYNGVLETPAEQEVERAKGIKGWIKKQAGQLQELAGKAMFAARWAVEDKIIDRNVTPEMTQVEADKLRDKNRKRFLLGAGVLTVAAGAAAFGAGIVTGIAIHEGITSDAVSPDMLPGKNFGGFGATEPLSAGFGTGSTSGAEGGLSGGFDGRFAGDILDPSALDANAPGTNDVEGTGAWPSADALPDTNIENPTYDIPSGQGGIELFSNLGLSEATWYENAGTLARMFPGDFTFVGNDVQISHSGMLSADARQFIESIRVR